VQRQLRLLFERAGSAPARLPIHLSPNIPRGSGGVKPPAVGHMHRHLTPPPSRSHRLMKSDPTQALRATGVPLTRQREALPKVLTQAEDHPDADARGGEVVLRRMEPCCRRSGNLIRRAGLTGLMAPRLQDGWKTRARRMEDSILPAKTARLT